MGRTSNTRERTREAAERLFLDGGHSPEQITVDKILAAIKQGSRTTINEELKSWREEKRKLASLPAAIPENLAAQFLQLWAKALEESRSVFAAERERMEQEAAAANAKADDLAARKDELDRELEASQNQLRQQIEESNSLKQEIVALRAAAETAAAVAQTRIHGLEASVSEAQSRADQSARNVALTQAESARREARVREDFQEVSKRQDAALAQLRVDLTETAEANKRLEVQIETSRSHALNLTRTVAQLQAELERHRDELSRARSFHEDSQEEVGRLKSSLRDAEIELADLRATLRLKEETLLAVDRKRVEAEALASELKIQIAVASKKPSE